jgi:hypothetical protein
LDRCLKEVTLEARTRIGRYEIRSKLGAGGVYEVYRDAIRRLVATLSLKFFHQLFQSIKSWFARKYDDVHRLQVVA